VSFPPDSSQQSAPGELLLLLLPTPPLPLLLLLPLPPPTLLLLLLLQILSTRVNPGQLTVC
jgi:hypothetical protein